MNNVCPNPDCGAIYNVAAKDVGRRIKCKKCASALIVTDAGLEYDERDPPPVAAPPGPVVIVDDEEEVTPRRSGRSVKATGKRFGMDPRQFFKDIGGIPTLFFGFGAFLVIVFLFQPIIGLAAIERANGAVRRVDLDWRGQERKLRKDKKSDEEISKAREEFYKKRDKEELEDNIAYEAISTSRGLWMEMYGMMFGFLFLMAGSIGYMMPDQTLVRRILGTVVLGTQILIIFMIFSESGGRAGRSSSSSGPQEARPERTK